VVTSVTVGGPNAADFVPTGACSVAGTIVAPGTSCPINVAFTPRAGASSVASLTIVDNTGPLASPRSRVIPLTGSSLPVTTLGQTSVPFPAQKVGTRSAPQTVVVRNSGVSPLTVTSATITGFNAADFAVANLCTVVAPGGACGMAVTFAPSTAGGLDASLDITDNTGKVSKVALTGTGTIASIGLSSPSLAFPDTTFGGASSDTLTVNNAGTAHAVIQHMAITGTNSGDFTLAATSTSCVEGTNLFPRTSCVAIVSFKPSAAGARAGSLNLTIDGNASTVPLSGRGIATAPGRPGIGTATRMNASAVVRWTAPTSNGGMPITGYTVRVTNAVSNAQIGGLRSTTSGTARSLTVTSLVNGTAVRFEVRARNGSVAVNGAYSPKSAAVTPAKAPGAAVIGRASSGVAGGTVNAVARWSAPASNGGSAVNGYQVRAQRISSTGTVLSTRFTGVLSSARRSVTMTLPAGKYRFAVRAHNAVGWGAYSARSGLVTAR
jgi:hypothetical protein